MEGTAIAHCSFDDDRPIYVGQVPPDLDSAVQPCILTDVQIPIENNDVYHTGDASETGQEKGEEISPPVANVVSCEKPSDVKPFEDAHQNMENSQGLTTDVTDKNESWDTESLDCTLDSSCAWVDECSDDDDDQEIRVGHELKSVDSSSPNKDLKSQLAGDCEESLLEFREAECIPEVTAEKRSVDKVSSSTAIVTQSAHLSRYEAVSGDDLGRTNDAYAKASCESGDLNVENYEASVNLEHQRLSESEIPNNTNDNDIPEDQKTEFQEIDASDCNSNSLRTRRKRRRKKNGFMFYGTHSRKSRTPSKSVVACSKGSKTTCKEGESDEEETCLSPSRQTSPESRNRIDCDGDEGNIQNEMMCFECDENKKSHVGEEAGVHVGSLYGKEIRSGLMTEGGHNDTLEGNAVPEIDNDCEPVSSQIYIGAPMCPLSDARCEISVYQNLEDIPGAGEGDQLNVDDTLRERMELAIPESEGDHELEKSTSKANHSKETEVTEPGVEANSPCCDVLKTSNRQRRSPRSSEKQLEIVCNEQDESDNLKEENTLIRTRRGSRGCTRPRKQRQIETEKDGMDKWDKPSANASVETSLQTVPELVPHKEEAPENEAEGPTPPEERPIFRARRRRASSKKSASDLIRDLTAASESALKRVSESTSPPSSKENQESVQTDQMVAAKKKRGRPSKARGARKRKFHECSPEGDDHVKTSDKQNQTKDPSPGQNPHMIRSEYASHDEDSGVDDDGLINPVLTPDSKTKDLPPAFSISDVVWAQDPKDKLRWPSVVIEVAGENVSRRVYSVFKTYQTKEKYFQVKSSRYLKPYNCKEKEEYLEKGKGVSDFHTAVQKANDFIMKIGLGKVNSHEDFFRPSDAYPDSPPPSPCDLSPPSPLLRVGHNIHDPVHFSRTNHDSVDDIDDDKDEEDQSLNDRLSIDRNICHRDPKEITKLKRKWQRKEKRLLQLMRSPEAKEYLVSIQHGKIASLRHQWFLSNKPIDKGRLLRGSLGALISEEKRHEIMKHLKNILTVEESLKSSHQYIMDVALPEALNFAYQKANKVREEEAELLIHTDGQQVARDLDIG